MIGMSQIRKKLYTGIAIGSAVGIVGIGITLWWGIATIKSYEAGTNAKYNDLYTKMVCVVNKDVVQGQTITSDMLNTIRVHKGSAPNGVIEKKASATDQIAKFNIAANSPITANMLTEKVLSSDIREQEINTILMPSDLVEGKFVDIRIMFPNGTDYIVLTGKQVNKISGQTMWLTLKEDERLILNSAVVDSFLNKGTKLYATEYADSESQIKLQEKQDEVIKGEINALILKELPELATLVETKNENEQTTTDEKVTSNIYVDKVFDFIKRYNNITASSSMTKTTYQPNDKVMAAMGTNGNISTEAKDKLSNDIRSNIENLNNQYEATNSEKISNVVSGAQGSITEQENQRRELLGDKVQ
ncbi:MAG: SAF domain-containing protein [Clostridia bacterium]